MKVIGYTTPGDVDALDAHDIDEPELRPHDLRVEVRATALNPADYKVRAGLALQPGPVQVLGYDAAGVVLEVGPEVTGFAPGDAVYYAGDITRLGANAERQVVDARVVGKKPETLDFAEAAALPLTSLTAWETLFDRLRVDGAGRILVLGSAGGVGSVLVPLAKAKTDLQVIGTASRPESRAWVEKLGADVILDHSQDLAAEARAAGLEHVDAAIALNGTDHHLAALAELIRPQGQLALVDDPTQFDIFAFKMKSISMHWEFMFTRTMYETPDIARQGEILTEVARLVDAGHIRSGLADRRGALTVSALRQAHADIAEGRTIGKIGFDALA